MNSQQAECRQGFTLIEMLMVITIIGILAAVGMVAMGRHAEDSRVAATRITIDAVRTAILNCEMTLGRYPKDLAELVWEGDEKWPGPFLDAEEVPRDAWGRDLKYELRGKRVRVTSAGRDGIFGNEDDLWK